MRARSVVVAMVAVTGFSVVTPVPEEPVRAGSAGAVPGSFVDAGTSHEGVIVFFDEAPSSTATLNAVTDETNLSFSRTIDGDTRVYQTSEPLTEVEMERLSDDLSALGNVVDVVPDVRVRRIDGTVYDPFYFFNQQKPLTGPYGLNPLPAWALTLGEGTKVAVLDTGIATGHPDLQANIVGGFDFVSANEEIPHEVRQCEPPEQRPKPNLFWVANDGNGWDGDPSDPGDWGETDEEFNKRKENYSYCYPNLDQETIDRLPRLCDGVLSSWHGTHVSGTIAALQNNTDPVTGDYVGLTGVAPSATVVPVRVMGRCGGYLSDLISAMKWSVGLPVSGAPANSNPARVLNLSLGANQSCTTGLATVINDVTATGALIVAAAGNDNVNASGAFPANCTQTLAVAAVNDSGLRASFSNYGSLVDVAAPGVSVVSTWNDGDKGPGNPVYARASGTSMAAPHVAGVAALVLAANPALTPEQLTGILKTQVTAFPLQESGTSPCSTPNTCGSGIVNAGSAVTFAAANVRPSEPRNVTADRSGRDVTVSWEASSDPGTSAISSYTVLANGADACTATGTELSCVLDDLALGTYVFTVVAANDSGRGPVSSTSATVTVVSPPGPVTGLSVVRTGRSVEVSWTAPAETGGLTVDYVVVGGPSGDETTSGTSFTFDNLTVSDSYTFGVKARNDEGESVLVMGDTVTIHTAPAAVSAVEAARTDQSVTVSWDATSSTGGLAVEYVVVGGPAEVVTTDLSATFSSLQVESTYTFGVKVRNSEGTSSTVFADPVTIYSRPSEPRNVNVTPGALSATVTWSAPSVTGGLPVRYVVSGGPGGNVTTSGTSYTVTGLTTGESYAFSVTAVNDEGLSNPVTLSPVTVSAPTTTTTTTTTVPPTTTTMPPTTRTTVAPKPVRVVKRNSRTAFNRIYVAPRGARTKWSARGTCSIRSSSVVASKWRGTCTVTVRQTLKGRTTTKKISIRVI